MILIKNNADIQVMRKACQISAGALRAAGEAIRPGITTAELDREIHHYILRQGAVPSFLGYNGFPGTACISVNEEVIHGIPSGDRVLKEGDIVSVDVGAVYGGFHGDNAATFPVGAVSGEAQRLMDVTRESLLRGIRAACAGGRIGDIGAAVSEWVEGNGFAVVRDFVGHGVGRSLHEDPEVPNYGRAGHGPRLVPGMTIAIEPMVNAEGWQVRQLSNGWTVVPVSGSLSAHFEHTILITASGPVILTVE